MRIILCLRRTLDQDNRTEEGSESRCSPSKNCVQEMFLVVSSRQQLSLYVWPLDLVLGQGQGLHGIPRIGFPQNPILHRSQKLDIFCCHFHSRDTSKARLLFLLIHTHVLISFNQLCWLFQSYFKCKLFLLYKTCRLFNYSTAAPADRSYLISTGYSYLISNEVFFYLNLPVGCSYLNLSVSCSYIILPVSSSCFILPAGCMVHAVDAIPSSRIASKSIAIALEDKILVVTYTRARQIIHGTH